MSEKEKDLESMMAHLKSALPSTPQRPYSQYDRDGIRTLSDAELNSDTAKRLQDMQRRLARIAERLLWLNIGVWLTLVFVLWRFGAK